MDDYLQSVIPSLGLAAGQVPIFLTDSVVMGDPGISLTSNCCVLGYHSGTYEIGDVLLPYGIFSIDSTGLFGNDVSTMSHEFSELINDPAGNNPTPAWGGTGQVPAGSCQNNLEVGDPLSPGGTGTTNEWVVNGYHLQELAFSGWFFGVNIGAGGLYSDHGTFTRPAQLCPPGGR